VTNPAERNGQRHDERSKHKRSDNAEFAGAIGDLRKQARTAASRDGRVHPSIMGQRKRRPDDQNNGRGAAEVAGARRDRHQADPRPATSRATGAAAATS